MSAMAAGPGGLSNWNKLWRVVNASRGERKMKWKLNGDIQTSLRLVLLLSRFMSSSVD